MQGSNLTFVKYNWSNCKHVYKNTYEIKILVNSVSAAEDILHITCLISSLSVAFRDLSCSRARVYIDSWICKTWSKIPKTGFLVTRLICGSGSVLTYH